MAGLFGTNPNDALAAQQAAEQKTAMEQASWSPEQWAGYAQSRGGQMAGRGIRGLLGIEDPELKELADGKAMMEGVDINDPDALENLAKAYADKGMHRFGEEAFNRAQALKKSRAELEGTQAQTQANIAKGERETAMAERALADARRLSREEGFKNLPPEIQTILLMEQRDPAFDANKAMQDYLEKKGGAQWSDPYQLGGATVQRNAQTGEIRTAVSRPPVTTVNTGGQSKADKDAEEKAKARQAEINMAENNSYRAANAMQTAKEALDLVNWRTTGAGGAVFSLLPGTDAVTLYEKADTLRSILSFAELAKMRAESKTGGALGSIAVKELELLGKTVASLSNKLKPDALAENIQKIYTHLEKYKETMDKIAAGGEQQTTPKPSQTRKTKSGISYTVEE